MPSLSRASAPYDFYPRPLRGGRHIWFLRRQWAQIISIHALCEEGDTSRCIPFPEVQPFLSTPSARRATTGRTTASGTLTFLSTPSARRATRYSIQFTPFLKFLSTPSARRATTCAGNRQIYRKISIHALCEEGDPRILPRSQTVKYFYPRPLRGGRPCFGSNHPNLLLISIHALCEEGDRYKLILSGTPVQFLSTPSARRATILRDDPAGASQFLSTPSARRATADRVSVWAVLAISIHALCEEGDFGVGQRLAQSRISIHALCEEGDTSSAPSGTSGIYFYPRPLRGGRRSKSRTMLTGWIFLSTPSARRATRVLQAQDQTERISIHALCEEGDLAGPQAGQGRRISIHALCEEGDDAAIKEMDEVAEFLSTPSARRATHCW